MKTSITLTLLIGFLTFVIIAGILLTDASANEDDCEHNVCEETWYFLWSDTDCAYEEGSDTLCDMEEYDVCSPISCEMADSYPG